MVVKVFQKLSMSFYQLYEREIRSFAKETIETLEIWLRRIIDIELSRHYGKNYLTAQTKNGDNLINNKLKESISKRAASNKSRYPRIIDAALLDEEISIICKPNLYNNHFKIYLENAFPLGVDEARIFLERLIPIRNHLYHANPITIRQAEQVICYSNDIIDSIKKYFESVNKQQDYNVPTIIKISDSLGSVFHDSQITRQKTGQKGLINQTKNQNKWLRVGETLTIEAVIDSSFTEKDFIIQWKCLGNPKYSCQGDKFIRRLTNSEVHETLNIICTVTSNQSWHRFGNIDDSVTLIYKVLPPI